MPTGDGRRPDGDAIVLMASPPVATGFGTIEGLGQHSEHEKITRLALKPIQVRPQDAR